MDKEIELRIQNLIQLRTNLYTALIVLAGGVCGVSLSLFNNMGFKETIFKYFLILFGMLVISVLISSLRSIAQELKYYLYSKEKKK